MKKIIAIVTISAAATLGLLAQSMQPLNVKTGLWQMTETVTWVGLPPQLAAAMKNAKPINYKSCVKPQDLSTNPWSDGSGEKCSWTVVKSNGTDMEVRGNACQMGKDWGMVSQLHGTIHASDSENGTATFDITLTGNGQTMNGHANYTGKWVSATCPPGMN